MQMTKTAANPSFERTEKAPPLNPDVHGGSTAVNRGAYFVQHRDYAFNPKC
jgi:hypothetical protein